MDSEKNQSAETLLSLRGKLDGIDSELKRLFDLRLAYSAQVAGVKIKQGDPSSVFAPKRESEILDRVSEGLSAPHARYVSGQFRQILRNSRALQYDAFADMGRTELPVPKESTPPSKLYLQGAAGSYQHIAARKLFPGTAVEYVPSFEEVFSSTDGDCAGILPLENTTAGVVGDVFDYLYRYDLFICGGTELTISHALIGRGDFEGIDTVLAHPQALKQCEEFLKKHKLKGVPCTNNAIAAKMVSESDSENVAAICSEECAEIYRLRILKKGISDSAGNTTRFVVLKKKFERVESACRVAVVFRTQNAAGALENVLAMFSARNLNVLALHSRPIAECPFEYRFYLEFSGKYREPAVMSLLLQMKTELPFLRILGTF